MLKSFRARRKDRAELALAEAEHEYEVWVKGWPSTGPKLEQRWEKRLVKLRRRVERL